MLTSSRGSSDKLPTCLHSLGDRNRNRQCREERRSRESGQGTDGGRESGGDEAEGFGMEKVTEMVRSQDKGDGVLDDAFEGEGEGDGLTDEGGGAFDGASCCRSGPASCYVRMMQLVMVAAVVMVTTGVTRARDVIMSNRSTEEEEKSN
ncbi:uncharacterized protein A4U43_C03F2770 [Asparagus officinalis]|uniref:Uncharacterized protein n=1 Tax=Asparagus officinalis TaxID=4686 RepID=A0A5P1FC19_ASPOF|nr:uncharacterized protein A4U43_C03F2770 [Asparagus officinalis]